MTKYLKQYAMVVLSTWLMSWAIVIYEPCCDSLFDETQHHKDHHTQHSHSDDHHASAESHHTSLHDCRVAIENLDDLTAPVNAYITPTSDKTEHHPDYFTEHSQQFTIKTVQAFNYHNIHPPPGKYQVYFSTQRFRI